VSLLMLLEYRNLLYGETGCLRIHLVDARSQDRMDALGEVWMTTPAVSQS